MFARTFVHFLLHSLSAFIKADLFSIDFKGCNGAYHFPTKIIYYIQFKATFTSTLQLTYESKSTYIFIKSRLNLIFMNVHKSLANYYYLYESIR